MEKAEQEGLSVAYVLQHISDAFVSLDQGWHYRFVNDRALSLMRKNKKELIGKSIWEVFPDMKGTIFEENFIKAMDRHLPVSFEAFHPGCQMWVEVHAYPYDLGIAIFYADVTEKKRALQVLQSAEEWFHNIADNAPVMIWSANTNKDFNYINSTWLKFSGRSIQQELCLGWLSSVFRDDQKRVLQLYCDAFNQRIDFRTEFRLLRYDGKYRWVSCAGKPLYAPDKTFLGYAGTCIDVDEQVMVYQDLENRIAERTAELTDVLEREKELNIEKSRFVSIASHEFRTPLSTMLSSLGLIEQYLAMNDIAQVQKHIGRINSSVKHMINILNDFLSLDRLDQGNIQPDKTAFDIDQCCEETIEELQPMLKPGQVIICDYTGSRHIYSDKKIIHNIMLNLLSNAIKYSEENISLKINLSSRWVDIAITDQGIGIPQEEQQQLFNRYFRASNAGNIKGTGLGLNIVARYVALLNGTIRFTSIEGSGTTFYVQFPNTLNSAAGI